MVLHQPLQGLEGQVQPVEARVAPLEPGDDAEGLQVVVEAAEPGQRLVERRLAGMAEGAVAEIVRQRDRLGQILVDPRARAMARAICATSSEWVSRVRKWSPSKLTNTCVLYSRRRNGIECTIRSRSRW